MFTTNSHCLTFDQEIVQSPKCCSISRFQRLHQFNLLPVWWQHGMWISKECYSIFITTVSSIIYKILDQFSWLFLGVLMSRINLPLRSSIFFSTDSWNIHMKYVKSNGSPSNGSISTCGADCSRTIFESIFAAL